jgi:ProP effector
MEQEKLSNQKETLVYLQTKYPKCFFAEGLVKPLKIGIFQDLVADLEEADVISKRLLRASLRHYTSSWRYLAAVKTGQARVDLQGEEGDAVEQQHAEHAAEQLKESKARAAAIREKNKEANKQKAPARKHQGYDKKAGQDKSKSPKEVDNNGASRRQANKSKASHPKRSSGPHQKKPTAQVKVSAPLADTELKVGGPALVKLGKDPMPVTITEINKDGVFVQLNSGMTVRVKQAQLYSSTS